MFFFCTGTKINRRQTKVRKCLKTEVKNIVSSLRFDFTIIDKEQIVLEAKQTLLKKTILNILVSFFLKLLKFSTGSIAFPPVFGLRANS
jgi:hypothetical protein